MISLVSTDEEARLGKESDPAIRAEFGTYSDEELAVYVQNLGRKLALRSELPNLDWHFTVLDSPVVNAFALPGGYIYITRGLLAHATSEAQLAGVLGHEIGHVTARHSAQQISRQQILGVGLGIGSILSPEVARWRDLAGTGLGLLQMRFSRSHERQADELGIRYMLRAGYDPREVPAFFDVLDRLQRRSGSSIPTWMSTHPAPENRMETTRQLAREAIADRRSAAGTLTVGRPDYLGRIDGMAFGDDPRQGYFDGTTFYHPDMRFTLAFPEGWITQNRPTRVLAADAAESTTAVLRLTLEKAKEGEGAGQFVRRTVAEAQGMEILSGEAETVHGLRAYLATVRAAARDGSRQRLFLAAVRLDERMFVFLGQAASGTYTRHQPTFTRVVRSFARLTDRSRLGVTPQRLQLHQVTRSQTLSDYLAALGTQPVENRELALLNQLRRQDQVTKGQTLKLIAPGS
jgi:predicted Zn-dependent protease